MSRSMIVFLCDLVPPQSVFLRRLTRNGSKILCGNCVLSTHTQFSSDVKNCVHQFLARHCDLVLLCTEVLLVGRDNSQICPCLMHLITRPTTWSNPGSCVGMRIIHALRQYGQIDCSIRFSMMRFGSKNTLCRLRDRLQTVVTLQ